MKTLLAPDLQIHFVQYSASTEVSLLIRLVPPEDLVLLELNLMMMVGTNTGS